MIYFCWPSRGPRLPQAADQRSALVPVEDRFDHVRLGSTLWADGVHLTESGHQILGQTIADTLLETAA